MTPTEGFPGSPTIAIGIVTTPPFAASDTADPEVVLPVVDADAFPPDELLAVHPAATNENAATVPTSANRSYRMRASLVIGHAAGG
jgi:hypothetical protein